MHFHRYFAVGIATVLVHVLSAATSPSASEAELLRSIQSMSELLRARIDKLPLIIPADHPLAKIEERNVTLNRDAVVVNGHRFDGVVVTAPAAKASFAWAFVSPVNAASWYILREKGDMKGFANFLRRPRSQVPLASAMKPVTVPNVTFQKLDSAALSPNERYIIWFRFTDDAPAELSIRAAFFDRASLNNNVLPSLLFPAGTK